MRWRGFWIRGSDGQLIEAPAADVEVLKSYPTAAEKGPVRAGERLTILSAHRRYRVGEPIRVLHVMEIIEAGREVFVMGPKPVCDEYVDGHLATPPCPADEDYDGEVLASPEIDYNYEVTTYRFSDPGPHVIEWRPKGRCSNALRVEILPGGVDG